MMHPFRCFCLCPSTLCWIELHCHRDAEFIAHSMPCKRTGHTVVGCLTGCRGIGVGPRGCVFAPFCDTTVVVMQKKVGDGLQRWRGTGDTRGTDGTIIFFAVVLLSFFCTSSSCCRCLLVILAAVFCRLLTIFVNFQKYR